MENKSSGLDFIAALILDVGEKSELLVVGDGAVYSGGEVYFVHYFTQNVHKNNAGCGGDGVGMCDGGDLSDLLICGICECKWRYSHKRAVAVGLLVGEAAPFVECGGGSIAEIKYLAIDGVVSVVEPVAKAICHVVGIDFAIAGANAVAGGNKQRCIIRERSGRHAVYATRCHVCASKGIATLKLKGYSEGISHSSAVDDCLEIIHCRLLRVVSIQCVKLQNGIGGEFSRFELSLL